MLENEYKGPDENDRSVAEHVTTYVSISYSETMARSIYLVDKR